MRKMRNRQRKRIISRKFNRHRSWNRKVCYTVRWHSCGKPEVRREGRKEGEEAAETVVKKGSNNRKKEILKLQKNIEN